MTSSAVRSSIVSPLRTAGEPLRLAFVGAGVWLDGCCPQAPACGLTPARFQTGAAAEEDRLLAGVHAFGPHISVIFDPRSVPVDILRALPGVTLGVLVDGMPKSEDEQAAESLDRLVSFDPALSGEAVGAGEIWRAIPPPVSDALYGEVRPLRLAPRAMTVGRSSEHRETMLLPAKHHHDLLQVIHGVTGQALAELLGEYDVGVYVAPEPGGGFGQQVGMHLAAGHLLLSENLTPAHGLERNIDYLQLESPDGLVWVLDRLGRFPEMHQRVRVRGRMKAEQYRASSLFARIAHDVLADVAAFGSAREGGQRLGLA
jgi:hypothetical protein